MWKIYCSFSHHSQHRVQVLSSHKKQQQNDLAACRDARNILTDAAEALAEKYEDASERQQRITDRCVGCQICSSEAAHNTSQQSKIVPFWIHFWPFKNKIISGWHLCRKLFFCYLSKMPDWVSEAKPKLTCPWLSTLTFTDGDERPWSEPKGSHHWWLVS